MSTNKDVAHNEDGNRNVAAQKLTEDSSAHAGFLKKYNPRGKVQNRYCVIHKGYFYYYKDSESKKTQGFFKLAGYMATESEDQTVPPVSHRFTIEHYQDKINTEKPSKDKKRSYHFRCSSQNDYDMWTQNINNIVLTCWPDSLYPDDFKHSEHYDYIDTNKVTPGGLVGGSEFEHTSNLENRILKSYKGPTLNRANAKAPTWVPDTPPEIPDKPDYVENFSNNKTLKSYDTTTPQTPPQTPPRPFSCSESTTTDDLYKTIRPQPTPRPLSDSLPHIHKTAMLNKGNVVDAVDARMGKLDLTATKNEMCEGYMAMTDLHQQPKNLNIDSGIYQDMQSGEQSQSQSQGNNADDSDDSDDDGPYVDLLQDHYDAEDDDDDAEDDTEDDTDSNWPAPPPTDTDPSSNNDSNPTVQYTPVRKGGKLRAVTVDNVDCATTDETIIKCCDRSVSVPTPTITSPTKMARGLTFPTFGGDIIEEYPQEEVSGRPSRMQRRVKEEIDLSTLKDEDIIPASCLHQNLERDQCVGLLALNEVGTYLIRTAGGDAKDKVAVVSRKSPPKVKHYMVFINEEGKMFLEKGHPTFSFLPELIKYYYKHNLPKSDFTLLSPLSCKKNATFPQTRLKPNHNQNDYQ